MQGHLQEGGGNGVLLLSCVQEMQEMGEQLLRPGREPAMMPCASPDYAT